MDHDAAKHSNAFTNDLIDSSTRNTKYIRYVLRRHGRTRMTTIHSEAKADSVFIPLWKSMKRSSEAILIGKCLIHLNDDIVEIVKRDDAIHQSLELVIVVFFERTKLRHG